MLLPPSECSFAGFFSPNTDSDWLVKKVSLVDQCGIVLS